MAAGPRRARKGPTLGTLHMIEEVMRSSDRPLRLNQIKDRLPRAVMHAPLREAIEHYKRLGCVAEGPKGGLWTGAFGLPGRRGPGWVRGPRGSAPRIRFCAAAACAQIGERRFR